MSETPRFGATALLLDWRYASGSPPGVLLTLRYAISESVPAPVIRRKATADPLAAQNVQVVLTSPQYSPLNN